MKKYRVIYYIGNKIDIKTKVDSGFVIMENNEIKLISKKDEYIANLIGIPLAMGNAIGTRKLKKLLESNNSIL